MSTYTTNNHYVGYLYNEDISTPALFYITERNRVLEIVNSLDYIIAIKYLANLIDEQSQIFERQYEDIYNEFQKYKYGMFSTHNHSNLDTYALRFASFLIFLEELKSDKETIFRLKYEEVYWLKSLLELHSLFLILKKQNIISVDFNAFCEFFALKRDLVFNLNQINLCLLFKKFIEMKCLSEFAFFSMLENKFIKWKTEDYYKYVPLKEDRLSNKHVKKQAPDAPNLDDKMQSLISELENTLKVNELTK